MTSSLVGSEMCIRDSAMVDLMADTDVLKINDITRTLQQTYRALDILPGGCLLYTSDAADDM
eukprot:5038162-Prorocentrum_lima.AAC.1